MVQVARIGIITAANSNPANSGQYYIDMFTRSADSRRLCTLAVTITTADTTWPRPSGSPSPWTT